MFTKEDIIDAIDNGEVTVWIDGDDEINGDFFFEYFRSHIDDVLKNQISLSNIERLLI